VFAAKLQAWHTGINTSKSTDSHKKTWRLNEETCLPVARVPCWELSAVARTYLSRHTCPHPAHTYAYISPAGPRPSAPLRCSSSVDGLDEPTIAGQEPADLAIVHAGFRPERRKDVCSPVRRASAERDSQYPRTAGQGHKGEMECHRSDVHPTAMRQCARSPSWCTSRCSHQPTYLALDVMPM